MRILLALLFLLFIAGCASNTFTVTLFRTSEVSGITERYAVDQNAFGTKTVTLGSDSNAVSKRTTYSIDRQLTQSVRGLVTDSLSTFLAIKMSDTGEVTTGLQIDAGNNHEKITWADVDPPKLGTPVLDRLYHIMLHVEADMISPQ
jgi:hypothetical protein